MTEWTAQSVDRLFELYEREFESLRQDVTEANVALGSPNPSLTRLPQLTRLQFEAVLTDPSHDEEAIRLWIRRIVRGHEHEFPGLLAAG